MEHWEYTNKLIEESSPYLLQHAHNPVNWYAWGEEAIDKAKREDKPIFLSIGYSTCYWCHAMEKESFENEEVAKILNEHFISIKVDREERPDIDAQYMLATQIMRGQGGWPNSVWLTPDLKPWMAATYLPKEHLTNGLNTLADYWKNRKEEVLRQAEELTESIQRTGDVRKQTSETVGPIEQQLVDNAIGEYEQVFDENFGGFGGAPKFPPHGILRVLIHEYRRTGDRNLLHMIIRTLEGIRLGGIHDHIGGGFHRYSTDNMWLLPHFEKMLYDNAQLMRAYTDGYLISNQHHFRLAVDDIFVWLQNEMISPEGSFYTAIDAGEFGKEGQTYPWGYDRIVEALGKKDAAVFAEVYNISRDGNFTEEHTGRKVGTNIIYLREPLEEIAKMRGENPEQFSAGIAGFRAKLLAYRNNQKQPHKDDKIVTGLNGLMIGALAYAGRQLNNARYIQTAANAADFIANNLVDKQKRFLRIYRAGKAKVAGFLDDYAYLAEGLLELYNATGTLKWLEEAQQCGDIMLNDFEDKENGGFFFSGASVENLLIRSKNLYEGGNTPAACGIAAVVLIELSRLTGQIKYKQSAERTLESLYGLLLRSPRSLDSGIFAIAVYLQHKNKH